MPFYQLIDRFLPRRLQAKLSLLVTALLILLVSLIGALFSDSAEKLLREQIGKKALEVAQSVAINQQIRQGLRARDADMVQPVAEAIRQATGAEYVVVGDNNEIRFSHPDPENIGKRFVGGDLGPALREGRSYASEAVGTLGPSLRGIVPIRGDDGDVVGFVAVGYLISNIESMIQDKRMEIFGYVGIVLLFGVFGATAIAHGLKSAIMGLEIHEIAALFHERNAIIGAIREGIIAVDGDGKLSFVNVAARQYLGEEFDLKLRGVPLKDVCPCPELALALERGEKLLDQEMVLQDRPMIVSILPLAAERGGLVASFRPKDELDRLARELSHAQEYSELLRAQTHEYSNKMHTIAGLLQLGAQQEALDLVINEASGYQQLIRNLAEAVPDPVIAGVILGKYNRACELKIDLEFDAQNSFADLPPELEREPLVTILGNLIDNAFDAVRESNDKPLVRLYLTDLGPDLIIEVEDSGPGVAEEVAATLFDSGVSTKEGGARGTGLALVKRAVESVGGEITFSDGELGGALFTVIIPK
ncbi:two-component system, CitB family, sensor histidine kinase DcuS [Malonomonas rubra DSM 5091]|uniref:histidine kinase n=1 Tax=Malonomonas rubra DSM 5091 TaxID=1122189 RepID=A0A1M6FCM0_MALRU|nr:sensor histidine kinase [Malonomonas rubra]SHI95504.1 two-component system, CitB family, sensor histidine kinase DcuS [Malonomonas rubra DSM 5091]